MKKHRSYEVAEVARLLKVCRRTVRRWIKEEGLRVVAQVRPMLILGVELIRFLDAKKKPKIKLRLEEFFCFGCQMPKRMAFQEAEIVSQSDKTVQLRALCEQCATVMFKRLSFTQLSNLQRVATIRELRSEQRIDEST